jgi:hypothetical protein
VFFESGQNAFTWEGDEHVLLNSKQPHQVVSSFRAVFRRAFSRNIRGKPACDTSAGF